jgi:hypothetical protein
MEETLLLNKSVINTEKRVRTNLNKAKRVPGQSPVNSVIKNLVSEGGDTFFHYLACHGLSNDPNLLVLPATNHFYYDFSELNGVTSLINLKKLNLIKNLDTFLHSLFHGLSPKSNFIGCFSDWKTQKKNGLPSRMYKGFLNFIDSKTDMEFDKNDVSRLLESHGFKVIDITEINGVSYFRAQNMRLNRSL